MRRSVAGPLCHHRGVSRAPLAVAVLALVALALAACGGGGGQGSGSASPQATTSATAGADGEATASARGPAWPTYGGSASRSGVVPGAPATPKLRRRFARDVDGQVYAQPLIARGRIYVATENNTVYAFTTGGKLVWQRHLGAPVPGVDLPCGNIDPSGITSTPLIAGGRLFVVAFLRDRHRHVLFGLRLGDGGIAVEANVDPPNALVEQQRSALLAAHGRIYVAYGGLFGDCGPFRGYVVSTDQRGRARLDYRNPATEAGIWAPAGISAQSGTLLVSTGNGGAGGFGYQNSVIRLSPALRRLGFWAPRDWSSLSAGDVDESSLAPLPVSGGRVFQIGKDGVGYLLRHSLDGVDGQEFSAPVCGDGAFGADAFRAPLAIVPCGDSLYGLRIIQNRRFEIAWTSGAGGMVPLIAGDSVFAITRDGTLNQLRFSDGRKVASTPVGAQATSFPAPAAAGHTLVAPAGARIVVFSI
jgi:outer membrane protein assembly factor BamB